MLLRIKDGQALLTGDAAYTQAGLRAGTLPLIVPDQHRYERSQRELRAFLEQADDVRVVVTGHDPETWPELAPVYG